MENAIISLLFLGSLILATAAIIIVHYKPRTPIDGVKEHRIVTIKNTFKTEPANIPYCGDCGDVTLSGNCYPKERNPVCSIYCYADTFRGPPRFHCTTHHKATKNALDCRL